MRTLLSAAGAALIAISSGPAFAGATTGTATNVPAGPPQKVITYVEHQPAPSDDVVVQGNIGVGDPLPQGIRVTAIPQYPQFAYAVVNHERVIVDPQTNKVIKILK